LIKTLKPTEFDILFGSEPFLKDYVTHIQENPSSLLSRILGVFEVQVEELPPMQFFITENMLGNDFTAIKRCYDLKGSTFERNTDLDLLQEITGETGLKVLKDINF